MIKEALEFLANQARSANAPKVFHPEQEPADVYYFDGKRIIAEPATRNHQALGLQTVIAFASSHAGTSKVWYSRCAVVCIIDDDTRRDRVTLKLDYSPQLKKLMSWGEKSNPLGQRDLILMLRTTFKNCMAQCPTLIDSLRVLKFSTGNQAESAVGKNKASISRSIDAQVSGQQDIPDSVFLNVPIFAEPFGLVEGLIDVGVDIDAGTEKIVLMPIAGAVDKQVALAEAAIGKWLVDALGEENVFYGQP